MKKILFSVAVLTAGLSLQAQTGVFFSEYVEGSGQNKALEIYNGTGADIDMADYAILLNQNGGGWIDTLTFPIGTDLTNGDVYVISNGQANSTILSISDTTFTYNQNKIASFNGDDARAIAHISNGVYTIIDQIGNENEDPGSGWVVSGQNNATKDNVIRRKPTVITGSVDTAAWSAGTITEWEVLHKDSISNFGMHTVTGPVTVPTIEFAQNGPININLFANQLPTTEDLVFTTANMSATSFVATAIVSPSNDTTLAANATSPVSLNITEFGTYGIVVSIFELPLTYVTSDTVFVNVVENTVDTVATIADLRAGTIGNFYHLSGEAIVTYPRSFRNQKFIQDATAGILIDDNDGAITTSFNRYDGMEGITGKLGEYKNQMQFVPTMDVAVSSTANTFTPEVITIADFNANPEDYESEVVQIVEGKFSTTETAFDNFKNYNFYVGADTAVFRTNFKDVDYIGTTILTSKVDLTCIPTQYNAFYNITARDANDIVANTVGINEVKENNVTVFPNPATDVLNVTFKNDSEKTVLLINSIGQIVYANKVNLNVVIPTDKYSNGIYTLLINENNTVSYKKIAIQ